MNIAGINPQDPFEFRNIRLDILRMNQSQLASTLGLSERIIGMYENGKQPISKVVSLAMLHLVSFS